MSSTFEIGDVATLDWEVRVDGILTDATVDVTVTLPDGTTATPAVQNPDMGVYVSYLPITQLGTHTYQWVATGAATAADTRSFVAGGFVSLDEAKRHLNIDEDDHEDDDELLLFVDAASAWVTEVVTDTSPIPVKLGTLELIRHLWDTQRGPAAGPLDEEGSRRISLGLAGFSIPNRVEQMLLPWLKPAFQPGARVQDAARGSFPDPSPSCWPDPADRVGAW